MSKTFLIGDTHFGHEKTCTTFKKPDGSPLRPFANAEKSHNLKNGRVVQRKNIRLSRERSGYRNPSRSPDKLPRWCNWQPRRS